ncbi:hypothetical protein CDAR_52611 [Caerostris darwini]|uniref:Uncharacterized protein n=1 Tax=Caerostris darwini TaxID=1538125 RepID=A0AAV4SZX3_9ARAC|nr:hypothetical protein CDAR_52611 [Caerostris darwini]
MLAAKTSSSMLCQDPRKKVAPRCNALNKCDIVSTCDSIHVFHFGAKPSHSKCAPLEQRIFLNESGTERIGLRDGSVTACWVH